MSVREGAPTGVSERGALVGEIKHQRKSVGGSIRGTPVDEAPRGDKERKEHHEGVSG